LELKLLKGARVFAPQNLGICDILLGANKILAIEPSISSKFDIPHERIEIVDLVGRTIVPGFVDQHVHIIGGGGSEGPTSRIPELSLSDITRCGITTVVGLLGLDTETKRIETLIMKAYALEEEGISTYIYTGGFGFPPITLMKNLKSDLALIPKILGVKIGLGEELSAFPTPHELAQLASDVYAGARLGGKKGIIHIHLGDCLGESPFELIRETINICRVPTNCFLITHSNWSEHVFQGACTLAPMGIYLDIDSLFRATRGYTNSIEPKIAVKRFEEYGVKWNRLTITTDANAVTPKLGYDGVDTYRIGLDTLMETFRELVLRENRTIEQVLELFTVNPAKALGIEHIKGTLKEGRDADLLVLTDELNIDQVYAKGRLMVTAGRPIVFGRFEKKEFL
jgi:beta-aspartyl-dipeptidase (metallo-type)